MWVVLITFLASVSAVASGAAAEQSRLPSVFVALRSVDASIRQDMRYAGPANFTGAVVDGYEAPECILTRKTAEALSRAQKALAERHPGHVLKVFDCYRPVRAVKRFAEWSREDGAAGDKGFYNPAIPRKRLFALGYIASQSGHSLGNVVDLTIERVAETAAGAPSAPSTGAPAPAAPGTAHCTAPGAGVAQPGGSALLELDMGTAFDCFDVRSHTHSAELTAEQKRARQMLLAVMRHAGFANYPKEWWHFSLPGAAAARPQDFPVKAQSP